MLSELSCFFENTVICVIPKKLNSPQDFHPTYGQKMMTGFIRTKFGRSLGQNRVEMF